MKITYDGKGFELVAETDFEADYLHGLVMGASTYFMRGDLSSDRHFFMRRTGSEQCSSR